MMDRGLQFLRNIIVARLVSPEDFGIAALFVMTVSFLEMFSNLAIDTLLVQSPHGEKPRFQQTSQLMTAVRGLAIALILLLFAGPVARLFDIPAATWAFRLLAVVPLIRGLAHQDMSRFQRQLNFKPRIGYGHLFPTHQCFACMAAGCLAGRLFRHSLPGSCPDSGKDGHLPYYGGAILYLGMGADTRP